MRLKTDENLPESVAALLRGAGHDVHTASAEHLTGQPDPAVLRACRSEQRALLTLDLGIANIRQYPPADYPGLIVLRPRTQSLDAIRRLVQGLLAPLAHEALTGHLWIVEPARIRIHG